MNAKVFSHPTISHSFSVPKFSSLPSTIKSRTARQPRISHFQKLPPATFTCTISSHQPRYDVFIPHFLAGYEDRPGPGFLRPFRTSTDTDQHGSFSHAALSTFSSPHHTIQAPRPSYVRAPGSPVLKARSGATKQVLRSG